MPMADIRHQITNRLFVVLTVLGIIPLFIFGQLIRLVWVRGDELRAEGERQASQLEVIPAMRGAIWDRNGNTLVINEPRYDLYVDLTATETDRQGKVITTFAKQKNRLFNYLAALTKNHDAAHYALTLNRAEDKKNAFLASGLTEDQKRAIEWWGVPGLRFSMTVERLYNYGTLAAHVLGYLAKDAGFIGLEKQYDTFLRGVDGRRPYQRSRAFRQADGSRVYRMVPVSGGPASEPIHGESIQLTLDLAMQTIVEQELAQGVQSVGANWGTAIAVNPQTGEILAMANVPTYDPAKPLRSLYEGHDPGAAQRNHAIQDQLEPGSTFKLVAALAALDQKKVSFRDTFQTNGGTWRVDGQIVTDDHKAGSLSLADIITRSSNIGIGKVAQKIDPGIYFQYARNLGFGQTTLMDLPGEAPGDLRHPGRWKGGEVISLSRGYSVNVTPLQMVMAYAALANDCKLMRPYIVAERRLISGEVISSVKPEVIRTVCNPKTAQQLRVNAFERAVEAPQGTGHPAWIPELRIAGKTGTARKVVDRKYSDGKYRASFIGMFPADHPKVVIAIILDEPKTQIYGGDTAAPIFKAIAKRLMGLMPEVVNGATNPTTAPQKKAVPVPNVNQLPAFVAVNILRSAGFLADLPANSMDVVTTQTPKAGTFQALGTRISFEVAKPDAQSLKIMPSVIGLDARQVVTWLSARGVRVTVRGAGRIRQQSPEAGRALPQHAILTAG